MADPGEVMVRGGAVSIDADLTDLELVAASLQRGHRGVAELAFRVVRVSGDPVLIASAARCPITGAPAMVAVTGLAAGPGGLAVLVAAGEVAALALRAAVALYRQVEATTTELFARLRVEAAEGLGRTVAFSPAAPAVAGALAGGLVLGTGVGVLAPQESADLLMAHPDVVQFAVAVVPPAAHGFWSGPIGPPVPMPAQAPRDIGDTAAWLLALLGTRPASRQVQVTGTRRRVVPGGAEPSGLVAEVARVGAARPAGEDAGHTTISVSRVSAVDGSSSWVVAVPGVQRWNPAPGRTPADVTSALQTMAGRQDDHRASVVAAMRAAGVPAGDPVMLTGHSLGGMTAVALAADPAFRRDYRVTHVVTAGSPVADLPVPAGVEALSLEHSEDVVVGLDGADNPDRADWVTVTAGLDATHPDLDLIQAHDAATYAETAELLDQDRHPSVAAWREGLGGFVPGPGATTTRWDVDVARGP